METSDSWLVRLAAGDVAAAESLWQHFFTRLQAYAEVCLRKFPPGLGEADDIALSVFKSLCRMASRRAIPSVRDPEQLWPLLAVIAARKVKRLVRRSRIGKPGQEIRETDLAGLGVDRDEAMMLGQVIGREPSPELMAAMREEWTELMSRLDAKERSIAQLWLENTTVPAISAATDIPERTVARKLAKIRRLIREMGGDEPGSSIDDSEL